MRFQPEAFDFFRREYGVSRVSIYAVVLGAWAVMGLLSGSVMHALYAMEGQGGPLWKALAQGVTCWSIYGAFSPLIVRAGELFIVKRGHLFQNVTIHLGFAFALGVPYAVGASWVWELFGLSNFPPGYGLWRIFVGWYLSGLPMVVLAYFTVLGMGRAVYWLERSRSAEVEAARFREEAAQARLAALQMQMHPHFLFNTLNAVETLVQDGDAEGASRTIHLLSDILRESLEADEVGDVKLHEELALVGKYLEIQSVRFSDRLKVSVDVPKDLLEAQVPRFLLQPLVENALRHGIGPHRNAGRLLIEARREGANLTLTVTDDGPGPRSVDTQGIGLGNLRSRLNYLFGPAASVVLEHGKQGGAVARVVLPFQPRPARG